MRNHFVPQHYLDGFTNPATAMIKVYPKGNTATFEASTTNVGLEKGYYTDEAEKYLTEEIEERGNPVLDKIRQGNSISSSDKRALSEYISALIKRGPWGKKFFQERAPIVSEELIRHFRGEGNRRARTNPSRASHYDKRVREIESFLVAVQDDPPREVWESTFAPDTTPRLIDALDSMTWVLLVRRQSVFLTNDNPVFLPGIGLGKRKSEFSFPISSNVVLWGSWRTDLNEGYLEAEKNIIIQLNRRIGATVIRHLFAGFEQEWISRIMTKVVNFKPLQIPKWCSRRVSESYDFGTDT